MALPRLKDEETLDTGRYEPEYSTADGTVRYWNNQVQVFYNGAWYLASEIRNQVPSLREVIDAALEELVVEA